MLADRVNYENTAHLIISINTSECFRGAIYKEVLSALKMSVENIWRIEVLYTDNYF